MTERLLRVFEGIWQALGLAPWTRMSRQLRATAPLAAQGVLLSAMTLGLLGLLTAAVALVLGEWPLAVGGLLVVAWLVVTLRLAAQNRAQAVWTYHGPGDKLPMATVHAKLAELKMSANQLLKASNSGVRSAEVRINVFFPDLSYGYHHAGCPLRLKMIKPVQPLDGEIDEEIEELVFFPDEGSVGYAYATGKMNITENPLFRLEDPRKRHHLDPRLSWIVSLPLIIEGQVLGVINIEGLAPAERHVLELLGEAMIGDIDRLFTRALLGKVDKSRVRLVLEEDIP